MPPRLLPSSLYAIKPLKSFGFLPSLSPSPRTLPHRPIIPKTIIRPASHRGPGRTQDNRHKIIHDVYYFLKGSPNARYGVGAVGIAIGGFYYYNLEKVPVSGRRRFNCISPAREQRTANSQYQWTMRCFERQFLPPDHPYSRLVQKVLKRLIPAAGLEAQNWEVRVIDDPDEENAFVLPGGKVFVFSGILPMCDGEDGVAAVLGHEIAHNIAHHGAEQLSHNLFRYIFAKILAYTYDIPGQVTQWILTVVHQLPHSRKMESEADYIGLSMMAQACYDPEAALKMWQRMAEQEQGASRSFLSTHPANEDRIRDIQKWLPQAQQKRLESKCGSTIGFVEEFRRALEHEDDMKKVVGLDDDWFW